MVTRDELKTVTFDFIKAVADAAKAKFGPFPRRVQVSQWMVNIGSNRMSGENSKRSIFDDISVFNFYRDEINPKGFPEQRNLLDVLDACGIPSNTLRYGFIFPLINHWVHLKNPFALEDSAIDELLVGFTEAALEKKVVVKSRLALNDFNASTMPIELEKDISIRPINVEELWYFGDTYNLQFHFYPPAGFPPSDDWKILDITLKEERPDILDLRIVQSIREIILTSLRLNSSGSIKVLDLGTEMNYGAGSMGGACGELSDTRSLNMPKGWNWGKYAINDHEIKLAVTSWPKIRKIMSKESHYLRLPAQRLFEGGERKQERDAILDYAIGLESLLTGGSKAELSYRFALRGATILGREGINKHIFFNNLKSFYDIRSKIVHGSRVNQAKLSANCSIGEDYLRKIWWWYFLNDFSNIDEGIEVIDDCILLCASGRLIF